MPAFSKRTIDGILARAKKTRRTVERGDSHDHAGLRFRATPAGKGTWFYRYRDPEGALRLTKLGDWPDMPLKDAREARDGLAKARRVHGGALPSRSTDRTFIALWDAYLAAISDPARDEYQRSHRETRRLLEADVVPEWRRREIDDITRADVESLCRRIGERPAPILANRVFAIMRALFNWAIASGKWGLEHSPCDRLKEPYATNRRDVWLKPAEVRAFLRAVPETFSDNVSTALVLALRTGQRIGEVAGLPWREVDLEGATWYLPEHRAKNGEAHEVPLPPQVVAMLRARPAGAWVFPGPTGDRPMLRSSVGKLWRERRDALGFGHVHVHDLRHTVMTHLAKLGCPRPVRERIANHRTIRGAADRYDHHGYDDEARDWLCRWNDELDRLAGINVVTVRRA